MFHARVDGHATATVSHPSLSGQTIVLCTPINESGDPTGPPIAAIDPLNSGLHSRVFISTDGSFTQNTVDDPSSPIRNEIIGIIDVPKSQPENTRP